MTIANIMRWSLRVSATAQAGAMYGPIVLCRLSRPIGGDGIARMSDLRPPHLAACFISDARTLTLALNRPAAACSAGSIRTSPGAGRPQSRESTSGHVGTGRASAKSSAGGF